MNPTCLRELHISSFYRNLSPGELESLFVALRDHCDPPSFEAIYSSFHDLLDVIDKSNKGMKDDFLIVSGE